jgi:PAS domain S-box-containing protein
MRVNEPITNVETVVESGVVLVSRTDAKGVITFANDAFVRISGFSEKELMGAPHNIVRHPHMPKEAFADLWKTVKSGRPWEGIVKNRTKDGGYYWVRANVTPEIENGEIMGYISLRVAPSRDQIRDMEIAYDGLRRGRDIGMTLKAGAFVSESIPARLGWFLNSISGRLSLIFSILILLSVVDGWMGFYDHTLWGSRSATALVFLVLESVAAVVGGIALIRYQSGSIVDLEHHFEAIAANDRGHQIGPARVREFARSNMLLRTMQVRLAFSLLEREEISRRSEQTLKQEMLDLTQSMENEISDSVAEITAKATRLKSGAEGLLKTAESLRGRAEETSNSTEVTSGNVQTVAGATEELEASSREIINQIRQSRTLSMTATEKVAAASRGVSSMNEATARIGGVVDLVRDIAGQTRMLALNATIEAARAGETGKGFAVVASEVKALAHQTETAIDQVNRQAAEMEQVAREAIAQVEAVAQSITEMEAISGQVVAGAQQQQAATAEIMSSAVAAADHTREVARAAQLVLSDSALTDDTAKRLSELSTAVNFDINALRRRLNVALRTSYSGNRRQHSRRAVGLRFEARFGNAVFQGYTADVSETGAFLVTGGVTLSEGAQGTVTLGSCRDISARVVAADGMGIRCRIENLSPSQSQILARDIDAAEERDKPSMQKALAVARDVTAAFEKALSAGRITDAALFDADYEAITGSDPRQFIAKHSAVADQALQGIVDQVLARDDRAAFCCVTDRNGYVSIHNTIYSQPQRKNDPVWNIAHCRNHRIFDDRAGILAARNTADQLVQTYPRDMGGGNFVILKEIDVPIMVGGKHWGGVRYGVKI